jgi:glycosyltransferase involved in cell wall biosynthesis
MSLIYFGYYCDKQMFLDINEEGTYKLSSARQNLEELTLLGLLKNFADIEIYSYVPRKKKKNIKNYSYIGDKQINILSVNKNNLFSNFYNLLKSFILISKLPKKSNVLMYAINPIFIIPLLMFRPIKKFTLTTICSELPQFRRWKENLFTRIKHNIQSFYNKRFSKYILISESMKDIIPVKNKPYIVMEGMVPNQKLEPKFVRNNSIMYAGALTNDNCILELIEATQKSAIIEKLLIFGAGPEEDKIRKIAENNKKISFFGVQDREKVLEQEKLVGALINLRDINNPISIYSFPSKLMEYMLSGTLILSTNTKGIPNEYFDHIKYIKKVEIDTLVKKIEKILCMDDSMYYELSLKQQEFVLKNKNNIVQGKKIIDFLSLNG